MTLPLFTHCGSAVQHWQQHGLRWVPPGIKVLLAIDEQLLPVHGQGGHLCMPCTL
jgi:hypothetical protein